MSGFQIRGPGWVEVLMLMSETSAAFSSPQPCLGESKRLMRLARLLFVLANL